MKMECDHLMHDNVISRRMELLGELVLAFPKMWICYVMQYYGMLIPKCLLDFHIMPRKYRMENLNLKGYDAKQIYNY